MLRPCREPGCRELVADGSRCAVHAGAQEARRGKTGERGYGWDWQKLSRYKLSVDPICQIRTHCEGALATEVDHIVPIRLRPELRLEWSNLQSSCKPCNVAKAARDRAQTGAKPAKIGGNVRESGNLAGRAGLGGL